MPKCIDAFPWVLGTTYSRFRFLVLTENISGQLFGQSLSEVLPARTSGSEIVLEIGMSYCPEAWPPDCRALLGPLPGILLAPWLSLWILFHVFPWPHDVFQEKRLWKDARLFLCSFSDYRNWPLIPGPSGSSLLSGAMGSSLLSGAIGSSLLSGATGSSLLSGPMGSLYPLERWGLLYSLERWGLLCTEDSGCQTSIVEGLWSTWPPTHSGLLLSLKGLNDSQPS